MSAMKELEGKVVTGLAVSACASYLRFELRGGARLCYQADGDCCSESWFADIVGVGALLGSEVRKVVELDLGGYDIKDGRCKQEEDLAYGHQLQTPKGRVDIIFRNSSNGYYGGSLMICEEPPGARFEAIEDDWMGAGGWPEDKALAVRESQALEKATLGASGSKKAGAL